MSIYIKVAAVALCLYLLIGIYHATQFAIDYDPSFNSIPNNITTFVINVLTWPSI